MPDEWNDDEEQCDKDQAQAYVFVFCFSLILSPYLLRLTQLVEKIR